MSGSGRDPADDAIPCPSQCTECGRPLVRGDDYTAWNDRVACGDCPAPTDGMRAALRRAAAAMATRARAH